MKIGNTTYTVGADPELFASKGNQFVSAHDAVPGTKRDPFKVNRGAVQVDGMALEFNIDPASSPEEFELNLTEVMAQLKAMTPELEFMDASSVIFPEKFLEGLPFEATELGCSVDFNAYSMEDNPSPNSEAAKTMRTVGGHVHIGGFFTKAIYQATHFEKCAHITRLLDHTLGLPSLLWDKDDKRRAMYGKSGAFRPKTYGVEYRTLSNSWIFSPALRKFVFDGVERALQMYHDGHDVGDEAQQFIDNSERGGYWFDNHPEVQNARKVLNL